MRCCAYYPKRETQSPIPQNLALFIQLLLGARVCKVNRTVDGVIPVPDDLSWKATDWKLLSNPQ